MKSLLKHTVLVLLLSSYTVLGVAGPVDASRKLFVLGGTPSAVAKTKSADHAAPRVYWTQHKHIPASFKVSVSAPVLLPELSVPHSESLLGTLQVRSVPVVSREFILFRFSRPPPYSL